ncbi:MAG: hypothetical protein V3W45_00290, partial [Sedimentisphaerales bacterium]
NYYMQNKPNFQKAEINITPALATAYENISPIRKCENKPNQTQFQPKNEANKPKTNPISAQKRGQQTQSNPISRQKNAVAQAIRTQPSCGNGCQDKICNTLIDLHRFGW